MKQELLQIGTTGMAINQLLEIVNPIATAGTICLTLEARKLFKETNTENNENNS